MTNSKIINSLLILVLILLIILVVLFYNELIKYSNMLINKVKASKLFRSNIDDEIEKYSNIFAYIEKNEEPTLFNTDISCYDNNLLVEKLFGKGKSCKTLNNTIANKNFKPETEEEEYEIRDDSEYNEEEKPIFKINNNYYSFSEVCPETAKDISAQICLLKKYNDINLLSNKLGSLTTEINDLQENKLNKLIYNLNTHKVDNNRLYNNINTKNFIRYDKRIGFNKNIHKSEYDIIDNLNLQIQLLKK